MEDGGLVTSRASLALTLGKLCYLQPLSPPPLPPSGTESAEVVGTSANIFVSYISGFQSNESGNNVCG